jgi:FixJ family two-component response regulator
MPRPLVAIVDDDASALAALTSLVDALGFRVRGFPSAAEFLASGAGREASCLIADVRAPEMGGIELFRRISETDTALPTILVTAYPDEATRRSVLEAGARRYLSKPVEAEELLGALNEALRTG